MGSNATKKILSKKITSSCSNVLKISNGNRTEWSTIQGVIGRVI